MRIGDFARPIASAPARRASGSSASFSLGSASGGVQRSAGAAPAQALLALVAGSEPQERRRRAIGKARRLLDALDEMSLSLLSGRADGAALQRLSQEAEDQTGEDAPPGGVLDQIRIRAEVELAKAEMRGFRKRQPA